MSTDRSYRIAIYCGYFNPPHLGHVEAAKTVSENLMPEKLYVIPFLPEDNTAAGYPSAELHMQLCSFAFGSLTNTEVIRPMLFNHKSPRAASVLTVKERNPEAELYFIVGSDDFLCLNKLTGIDEIINEATIAVLVRTEDDYSELQERALYYEAKLGLKYIFMRHDPLHIRSDMVRERLKVRLGAELLPDDVYGMIIRNRLYCAEPELAWLREKVYPMVTEDRIEHVAGCENEATVLAGQYGENPELAAEAAILHDITKALSLEEQLSLCKKYALTVDETEAKSKALLHAKTGAALAKELFGVSNAVEDAIRWHTTGRPNMTLLEKIIYLADYIEPTRDFDGVEKLREAVYKDLDEAMLLGLEMSLEDLNSRGLTAHSITADAACWYSNMGGH